MTGNFHRPKDSAIFSDSSDNWLKFRRLRFAVAGDGEFATLSNLDLSGLKLGNFVADHLVFAHCKLDGASFAGTHFVFDTTFIDCSMRRVDFTRIRAASALFYKCDLSGSILTGNSWISLGLNGQKIKSYFVDCTLDDSLSTQFEFNDIFVGTLDELKESKPYVRWRLYAASEAPLIRLESDK